MREDKTLKIDIDQLHRFHDEDKLVFNDWGDAKETACLMSALTGRTNIDGCAAEGWPKWLAELGTVIFDYAPDDERWSRALAFAEAVTVAEDRGADFDRVFRDIRLNAILPISMETVGEGNEPWRVKCRKAVQWSLDHDGGANLGALDALDAALARLQSERDLWEDTLGAAEVDAQLWDAT